MDIYQMISLIAKVVVVLGLCPFVCYYVFGDISERHWVGVLTAIMVTGILTYLIFFQLPKAEGDQNKEIVELEASILQQVEENLGVTTAKLYERLDSETYTLLTDEKMVEVKVDESGKVLSVIDKNVKVEYLEGKN